MVYLYTFRRYLGGRLWIVIIHSATISVWEIHSQNGFSHNPLWKLHFRDKIWELALEELFHYPFSDLETQAWGMWNLQKNSNKMPRHFHTEMFVRIPRSHEVVVSLHNCKEHAKGETKKRAPSSITYVNGLSNTLEASCDLEKNWNLITPMILRVKRYLLEAKNLCLMQVSHKVQPARVIEHTKLYHINEI